MDSAALNSPVFKARQDAQTFTEAIKKYRLSRWVWSGATLMLFIAFLFMSLATQWISKTFDQPWGLLLFLAVVILGLYSGRQAEKAGERIKYQIDWLNREFDDLAEALGIDIQELCMSDSAEIRRRATVRLGAEKEILELWKKGKINLIVSCGFSLITDKIEKFLRSEEDEMTWKIEQCERIFNKFELLELAETLSE